VGSVVIKLTKIDCVDEKVQKKTKESKEKIRPIFFEAFDAFRFHSSVLCSSQQIRS